MNTQTIRAIAGRAVEHLEMWSGEYALAATIVWMSALVILGIQTQ